MDIECVSEAVQNAHRILPRFRNCQDAEDHKRFLRRFIPKAQFEVLFDVPKEEEEENQSELLQET